MAISRSEIQKAGFGTIKHTSRCEIVGGEELEHDVFCVGLFEPVDSFVIRVFGVVLEFALVAFFPAGEGLLVSFRFFFSLFFSFYVGRGKEVVSSLLFLGAEFTGVQQLACVILLWVGHVVFMYMCVMSNMYEVGGRILMDGVGRWMESEDNLPGLSEPALTTNSTVPTSYFYQFLWMVSKGAFPSSSSS